MERALWQRQSYKPRDQAAISVGYNRNVKQHICNGKIDRPRFGTVSTLSGQGKIFHGLFRLGGAQGNTL